MPILFQSRNIRRLLGMYITKFIIIILKRRVHYTYDGLCISLPRSPLLFSALYFSIPLSIFLIFLLAILAHCTDCTIYITLHTL